MIRRLLLTALVPALTALAVTPVVAKPNPAQIAARADAILKEENKTREFPQAAQVDDLGFLRRIYVDLIGRIPTDAEIQQYQALPAAERRTQTITQLLNRNEFANRWAVFFNDMFRVRYNIDGGAALQAYVHEALRTRVPYDVLAKKLIGAAGRAGSQPETGFILNDDADPLAMTGVVSQVFLGIRISCAQCHDHPFDVWSREDFYDLAAFFGKTRRVEQRFKMRLLGVYLQEMQQTSILWPPEDKAKGKTRKAVSPKFPFELDATDGPNHHVARLTQLREELAATAKAKQIAKVQAANVDDLLDDAVDKAATKKESLDVFAEAKKDVRSIGVGADMYKASELRHALADHVTNPLNKQFARNIVNRVWAQLIGRGFVNPVDDFRKDNPASHPRTLDFLAEEFIASGYDFQTLVQTIVLTPQYQRGKLTGTVSPPDRLAAEEAFATAPARRMISEAFFDSIVQAGHLFTPKHRPGDNMVTVVSYQRVAVGVKDDPKKPNLKPLPGSGGQAMMPGMNGNPQAGVGGYDLERGIEIDFKKALKKEEELAIEKMKAVPDAVLEAEMMKNMPDQKQRMRYKTVEVRTQVDDNPVFFSSMKMASPAPAGHFLRVFGQTDRSSLDEIRDHSPSMRQALMMVNGKLTNEAARVGPLEPMYKLVAGEKANLEAAIDLAYREILTRSPNVEEVTEAKAIIADAQTPIQGMADLRWALLNCNEFRYLP
ncbi:MAG: DUF1549 and DUF1553 domain-containing protein [Bacteroidales bacterium]|nr:DUF1549 and DUF1553 domain-containing protein [Bacteroidales bacterium]